MDREGYFIENLVVNGVFGVSWIEIGKIIF